MQILAGKESTNALFYHSLNKGRTLDFIVAL